MARRPSRRQVRAGLRAETGRAPNDPAFTRRLAQTAATAERPATRRPSRRTVAAAVAGALVLVVTSLGIARAAGVSLTPWAPDHPVRTPPASPSPSSTPSSPTPSRSAQPSGPPTRSPSPRPTRPPSPSVPAVPSASVPKVPRPPTAVPTRTVLPKRPPVPRPRASVPVAVPGSVPGLAD